MEIRYPAVLELVRFVDLEKAAAALGKRLVLALE